MAVRIHGNYSGVKVNSLGVACLSILWFGISARNNGINVASNIVLIDPKSPLVVSSSNTKG